MCDQATLENGGTLESISYCNKNQQMCDKAVDNYCHVLKYVPDSYMAQKTHDTHPSTKKFVPERYKIQEIV